MARNPVKNGHYGTFCSKRYPGRPQPSILPFGFTERDQKCQKCVYQISQIKFEFNQAICTDPYPCLKWPKIVSKLVIMKHSVAQDVQADHCYPFWVLEFSKSGQKWPKCVCQKCQNRACEISAKLPNLTCGPMFVSYTNIGPLIPQAITKSHLGL